jgi:nucleoside-diphosphate-sugar epimerase
MRIFVTGGSGYIGRAVLAELVRRGHTVGALVRSEAAASFVHGLGAQPVSGSLDTLDVVERAAAEHDATIHIAGIASADDIAREVQVLDVLLRAATPGYPLVYTSGAWVYGDRGDAVIDEDAPLKPPSWPGVRRTKRACWPPPSAACVPS